ncbi:hypothetical protein KFE98_15250 [bacterium SCSIO 12741]|nr:hypothetical protein KFE98_15250 [bacterium SCSIO 12741]
MFQKITLLLLFTGIVSLASSQDRIELINSGERTTKAEELYRDGQYQEARELLESIHENDTNYEYALSELAYVLYLDSQYTASVEVCDRGLEIRDAYETRLYNLKGLCYKNTEQYEKAEKVFLEAIGKFPRNHLFHFNLANTYMLMDEYQKSYDYFKSCVRINPLYANAYGQMAYLLEGSDQLTAAFMCMNMKLLNSAYSDNALMTIIRMEALSKNETVPDTNYNIVDEEIPAWFKEIDWILKSRIALNKRYECQSALDFHVVRQTQVMLEKLQYEAQDTGFWNQQLVKYFNAIYKENRFSGYVSYLFQSVQSEEVQAAIVKSKNDFLQFSEWYANDGLILLGSHPDGKGGITRDIYYDDMSIYGIGPYDEEKGLEIGTWQYFHSNTRVSGTGPHNSDGEQHGAWKWYYPSGEIKEEAVFVNGTLNGPYKAYNEQGILTESYTYAKDGSIEGLVETFYQFGGVKDSLYSAKGKRVGTNKTYHSNGQLYNTISYKKGLPYGPYVEFYDNGDTAEVAIFEGAGSMVPIALFTAEDSYTPPEHTKRASKPEPGYTITEMER